MSMPGLIASAGTSTLKFGRLDGLGLCIGDVIIVEDVIDGRPQLVIKIRKYPEVADVRYKGAMLYTTYGIDGMTHTYVDRLWNVWVIGRSRDAIDD